MFPDNHPVKFMVCTTIESCQQNKINFEMRKNASKPRTKASVGQMSRSCPDLMQY